MKQYLLSLMICCAPVLSFSQSFTVEYGGVEIIGSVSPIYTYEGDLTNNAADTLFVRMTLIPQTMPAEWELGICTINGCFPAGVFVDSFAVAPNQSEIAWVEFFVNQVSGMGSTIVLFENRNDGSDFVEVTLNVEAEITGVPDLNNVGFFVSQNYPNPFRQSTFIDYELRHGNGILSIRDHSGKLVKSYGIEQSGTLSLGEALIAGSYTCSFRQNGKIYHICKMIKTH